MNLEQWIITEQRLRQATSIESLQLLLVNALRQAIPYGQALLFERIKSTQYTVHALSNVSEVNPQSPTVHWMSDLLAPWLWEHFDRPSLFVLQDVPKPQEDDLLQLPYGLYIPLISPIIGQWGLVLLFDKAPDESLSHTAVLIAQTIVHAWERLLLLNTQKPLTKHTLFLKKRWGLIAITVVILLFLIHLRENTIAPAEVIPSKPILVTPSINGTIRKINVSPNQTVKKGQILLSLDDITLRNQMEEAQKDLKVAEQRYLKAYHHAYSDTSQANSSLQEMSVLQEEQEQARVKYEYQKKLLERSEIRSPEDGVVLYSDPKELLGKPVRIGEKIMLVANPQKIELEFWINMDNMMEVDLTQPLYFFSNENPATHAKATIQYINPVAEARPDNTVAYYGVAHFAQEQQLQLGEQGVAKLYGKKVSLIYYIVRRPLRYIRQHLGV